MNIHTASRRGILGLSGSFSLINLFFKHDDAPSECVSRERETDQLVSLDSSQHVLSSLPYLSNKVTLTNAAVVSVVHENHDTKVIRPGGLRLDAVSVRWAISFTVALPKALV